MRHSILGFALLCLVATPAAGRDLFVDNVAGSDLFNGFYERPTIGNDGPTRTIAKALRICEPGDRILLANSGEPYHEMISLAAGRHWGFAHRPLTIDGQGAILDGTAAIREDSWQHASNGVFRFPPRYKSTGVMYFEGKPLTRRETIDSERGSIGLEPLQWRLDAGYAYFRPEKDRLPQSYDLRYTRFQTGITLYHVRHVRIENLVVQGFSLDGINAQDGVYHCTLSRITARGNGRSGISVGGASQVRINDSLLGDNGLVQLRVEGLAKVWLNNTEIIDNTAPAKQIVGGRMFVDGEEEEPAPSP